MLTSLMANTENIYLALGTTDFRKQVEGLVAIVNLQFNLDPFAASSAFVFCNKRRTSIKVLRYDKNGFVLASKKLLEGMKFQWPKEATEVKNISIKQVEWLLQGLEIEPQKAHHSIEMSSKETCY